MHLTFVCSLVISTIAITSTFAGRIIQCTPPTAINATIACTTSALPNGNYANLTRCTIFCKDNHVRTRGPKTIYCYRARWLQGGDGNIPYSHLATCSPTSFKSNTFLGRRSLFRRNPFISESKHDGKCSQKYCHQRYSGITKSVCSQFKCCWNEVKKDCFTYLEQACQIRESERSHCTGSWKGISARLCKSRKCCHDNDTGECYSAKKAIHGLQITPTPTTASTTNTATNNEVKSETQTAAVVSNSSTAAANVCAVLPSERTTCRNTWPSIPQFLCLAFGCCYDKHESHCFSASEIDTELANSRHLISTTFLSACSSPYLPNGATLNCTNTYRVGSVCSIECPPTATLNEKHSGIIKCTSSGRWDKDFNDDSCIDVKTKKCDLDIDLSNGNITYADESQSTYVRLIAGPELPKWKKLLSGGNENCAYQALLEVDYTRLKAFALRMKYDLPSRHHFQIASQENSDDSAVSISASSYHLKGIPGKSGRGMIPPKAEVMFLLTKSSRDIIYGVDRVNEWKLPVPFPPERRIKIGLNRKVFLAHSFDIASMGSGMCRFCLVFSPI